MPTYDYVCDACGHALELFQSMSEAPKRKCPACGKLKLSRRIGGGAGVLFKGKGFYQTDYRSESYKKAERKAEEGAKPEAEKPATEKPGGSAVSKEPKAGAPKADGGAKSTS